MGLGLVEFGARFVNEARDAVHEVPGIKKTVFTSRQSQAIVSLGISKLFRLEEELGADDLVNLAIITSPPEAQKYSEMIALRILFGNVSEALAPHAESIPSSPDAPDPPDPDPQIKAQHLLLQEVLDFLNLQKSVDLNKGLEELKFAQFAEEEIYPSDPSQHSALNNAQRMDLAKKRISYERINGREGILKNHMTSWEEVYDHAKKSFLQSIPYAEKNDIINSQFFDMNKQIQKLSREQYIKNLTELFEGAKEPEDSPIDPYQEIIDNLSYRELDNAIQAFSDYDNLLDRMKLEKEKFAPSLDKILNSMIKKLREEASNLDDVLSQPQFFDDLDRERLTEMLENTMQYSSPDEMFEKTKRFDDLFGTNLSSYAYDTYNDYFEDLSLEDLIDKPVSSSEWFEDFNKKMEEFVNDENLKWEDQYKIAQDLLALKDQIGNQFISQQLEEELNHFVERMIASSTIPEELVQSVEFAKDYQIPFNPEMVKKKGRELGMSEQDIAKLLGGAFEYLKTMIENQQASFEKVHVILDKANLPYEQRQQLINLSIKEGSEGALGALAAVDLKQVTDSIPNTEEGRELLETALGAGGGENLLHQWFDQGATLPPWLRDIVKKHAKRIMIDLAKKKAASLIGSSEAGPLPEGTTRPYFLGDDPDTIDLDETIDNILDQGKKVEDVRIDDFIVRKTVTGRRCVIFLVDISGSMSGAPLASSSIVTAMLLITFSRDELGVALFESNTHVLCEIHESIELDEVVDEILDLTARGGTQMTAALAWAEKQFEQSRSQDKMFIMVSDAGLGDFNRSLEHMRKIAEMGATSTLIVPHTMFGVGNIQSILQAANAELVPVRDWKNFPEVVSRILSRV